MTKDSAILSLDLANDFPEAGEVRYDIKSVLQKIIKQRRDSPITSRGLAVQ